MPQKEAQSFVVTSVSEENITDELSREEKRLERRKNEERYGKRLRLEIPEFNKKYLFPTRNECNVNRTAISSTDQK